MRIAKYTGFLPDEETTTRLEFLCKTPSFCLHPPCPDQAGLYYPIHANQVEIRKVKAEDRNTRSSFLFYMKKKMAETQWTFV